MGKTILFAVWTCAHHKAQLILREVLQEKLTTNQGQYYQWQKIERLF
jgi:hypothetical protein